ncbi:hypothetical protein T484DRAFT_1941130 [Baffinella frigidus]|nr:hypothetical protein T484DRAFT_1941130 [Cryptophyta sp. CCMP2293]
MMYFFLCFLCFFMCLFFLCVCALEIHEEQTVRRGGPSPEVPNPQCCMFVICLFLCVPWRFMRRE